MRLPEIPVELINLIREQLGNSEMEDIKRYLEWIDKIKTVEDKIEMRDNVIR